MSRGGDAEAEAAAAAVEQLFSVVERTRCGIPMLAIRNRHSGDPDSWAELGIGVLRRPLLWAPAPAGDFTRIGCEIIIHVRGRP